jgi:hypothetical protein
MRASLSDRAATFELFSKAGFLFFSSCWYFAIIFNIFLVFSTHQKLKKN